MIDLALLAPDLTEEDIARGCELAKRYGLGSVTLRPADVQLASQWLAGSGVTAAAAISYPHGAATTATKNYEVRDMLQRGAKRIETPVNLGKLKSRAFQYIELEVMQIVTECRRAGATVTLDLELPSLPTPDLRVIACKIARRTEVDCVRAASLYGGANPTLDDIRFLKARTSEAQLVDAGGWVRTLEDALAVYEAGASAFQTTDPAPILDAWKQELKNREAASATSPAP